MKVVWWRVIASILKSMAGSPWTFVRGLRTGIIGSESFKAAWEMHVEIISHTSRRITRTDTYTRIIEKLRKGTKQ